MKTSLILLLVVTTALAIAAAESSPRPNIVRLMADDPLSPGRLGFDEWVSADNFFDLDPVLGRNGVPAKFHGDSSDVTTDEALKFIRRQAGAGKPFLAVVWFGSPHGPHQALPADKAAYSALPETDQDYDGELTAVDWSVGRLRATLRELNVAENTLLWYCIDPMGQAVTASHL